MGLRLVEVGVGWLTLVLVVTTILDGWVALEEWKLRLTSAKVEVEVEAELGKKSPFIWVHMEVEVRNFEDYSRCQKIQYIAQYFQM